MPADARIATALPSHPKTKKLIRRAGEAGAWRLVCLFLWAAGNRPDGDLSGMSDEDIELAIDWTGEPGAFVLALADVGFLDGDEGGRSIHDWEEHNPWAAGAEARSEKGRWGALCKQHGRAEAERRMPEYAERLRQAHESRAPSNPDAAGGKPDAPPQPATGVPVAETGSAPYPSPSPSPSPIPSPTPTLNTPLPPEGGEPPKRKRRTNVLTPEMAAGFARFYAAYPRKVGKKAAFAAWLKIAPDDALMAVIEAGLRAQLPHMDRRERGRFIPHPSTWLNGEHWTDEVAGRSLSLLTPPPPPGAGPTWWEKAGFEHPLEAQNARCHIGNAHLYRHGKLIEVATA